MKPKFFTVTLVFLMFSASAFAQTSGGESPVVSINETILFSSIQNPSSLSKEQLKERKIEIIDEVIEDEDQKYTDPQVEAVRVRELNAIRQRVINE